jgi:hypothetical protein
MGLVNNAAREERRAELPERTPRNAAEAAQRVLALLAVVARSREKVAAQSVAWVRQHAIDAMFSAAERRFYRSAEAPSARDLTDFSWRAEAVPALIWALHGIDALPPLDQQVNIWDLEMVRLALKSPASFIAQAQRRPLEQIVDEERLHREAHWLVRNARHAGRPTPAGLNASIVVERRYALTWLVGDGDGWDEVPLDI